MNTQELYNKVEAEIMRLRDIPATAFDHSKTMLIEGFITTYIFSEVPDKVLLKLINKIKTKPKALRLPDALSDSEVLKQTIKVLTLMEISENEQEFKTLLDKSNKTKKEPDQQYQLTDFDKVLKAIASVPKPTKEQLKEYLKNRPKDISEEVRKEKKTKKK